MYTRDMTDNLRVFQDHHGFYLLDEGPGYGPALAEAKDRALTHAVVGKNDKGEHFLIPCVGTLDAIYVEAARRRDGSTEVQTLPIKDLR